ncbi:MAG: hypothetical protein J0L70_05065 [Leptolyngbya sp. UWPOB_LEPTO1]|uniref:hypothetical protein n=1 Tax=Leptolyngbya sp. UWPOB_LEPTO1 TaxID=2815653 RepID=UPI001AC5C9EC|nr:hypothetical protein [Leptolyngbya sp. UWPOB_LEPTO1]MBN8559871.1 hypothetical protein [Leptolyngbya sp. UWPOB_LEPTO1]
MSDQVYDWKRFWCPRSGQFDLSDRVYPKDLDFEDDFQLNPNLVTLEHFADVPCLILIGEAGIGKSHEIENLKDYTDNRSNSDYTVLEFNLRSCTNLKYELFQDEKFVAWEKGTHSLYLFLDSLDEGLLEIPTLVTQIIDEFKKDKYRDKLSHLYLRIACRSALAPAIAMLEDSLEKLWRESNKLELEKAFLPIWLAAGKPDSKTYSDPNNVYIIGADNESSASFTRVIFHLICFCLPHWNERKESFENEKFVKSYELTPLSQVDIATAVTVNGFDAEKFLAIVKRKGVAPFARHPISLDFLLAIFRKNHGELPNNLRREDIYEKGCRYLCKEQNPNRILSGRDGTLEEDERFVIAARIAAVTILTLRSTIWTATGAGEDHEKDISINQLCLGNEFVYERISPIEIDNKAIEEVLATGLFSLYGSTRMRWSHQSYAEFLAAWYLKHRNLPAAQILDLFLQSDQKIIPQLSETAAWLSRLDSQIFQSMMATDPDILLHSEILPESDEEKEEVVASLLRLHDQGKLVYQFQGRDTSSYRHWKHAELPTQLRAYICDPAKSEASRYVAIDVAEACHLTTVQDCLADITLNSQQSYWMRVKAAKAVKHLGNDRTKLQLMPLALSQSEDDLEDELKGHALCFLYPQYLTAEKVLESITQPKSKIIGGTYQNFLAKEFAKSLQVPDLPMVLTYLEKQPVLQDSHYPFNAMSDRILLRAWEHLDIREVLEPFAKVVLLKIRAHQQVIDSITGIDFIDLLAENDTKRRLLLETIINLIGDWEEPPYYLAGTSFYNRISPLKQDFLWLIEKIQESYSESVQRTYAWLVSLKLDWTDVDQVSAVITASDSLPILKAEFASFLGQIEIASSEAETARASYLRTMEERRSWKDEEDKETEIQPSPKERVLIYLEQFELGQVAAWWHLCTEMTLMPKSRHYGNEFKADLTMLPGWKEADDLTQTRIISAAKRYIYDGEPETDAWFGTNSFRFSALAGYKALRLIIEKDLQYILNISPEIWKKWTAIILDYPDPSDASHEKYWEHLLSLAYKNAPDEFIVRLMILLDQDNAQHGDIYASSQIECCWDEKLEIALCEKLHDEKLTDKSIGSLLKLLMKRQVKSAKAFAQAKISTPLPSTGKAREIAIVAAQTLMLYADDESWAMVWNASQQDLEYRKKVLESVSFANEFQGSIEYRLHEDYIADLYLFLVEHYSDPPKLRSTPQSRGFNPDDYRIDAEDSIRRWRNQIPYRLQQRGTRAACEALRKIIHYLPEQKDQLQWRLPETEASARRKEWQPPKPEEILQLLTIQKPSVLESYTCPVDERTQKTDLSPKRGFDWKVWLPIFLGIAAIAVSGLFNNEIRRFLKLDPSPPVEQKQEKSIK